MRGSLRTCRLLGNFGDAGGPPSGGVDLARSFNGSSDYISLPNAFFNYVSVFTASFSLWFQTSAAQGVILGQTTAGATPGGTPPAGDVPAIYIGNNNKLHISFFWSGVASNTLVSSSAYNDGNWHNVVITYNNSTTTLTAYVDGVSMGSSNAWTQNFYEVSGIYSYFLGVGYDSTWPDAVGGWDWFLGNITDIAMWNGVVLSAGNISSLATGARANTIGQNANLIGYLPIVGQSPEPDKSGNGNNGVLTGTSIVAGPPQLAPF
jgi:hypothetical protein